MSLVALEPAMEACRVCTPTFVLVSISEPHFVLCLVAFFIFYFPSHPSLFLFFVFTSMMRQCMTVSYLYVALLKLLLRTVVKDADLVSPENNPNSSRYSSSLLPDGQDTAAGMSEKIGSDSPVFKTCELLRAINSCISYSIDKAIATECMMGLNL